MEKQTEELITYVEYAIRQQGHCVDWAVKGVLAESKPSAKVAQEVKDFFNAGDYLHLSPAYYVSKLVAKATVSKIKTAINFGLDQDLDSVY